MLSLFGTPTDFSTIAVTVCFTALFLPFSHRSGGFVSLVCLGTVLLTSKLHKRCSNLFLLNFTVYIKGLFNFLILFVRVLQFFSF